MAKGKKDTEEQEVKNGSNDILAALLKLNNGDHFNGVIAKNKIISTGSLILDNLVKIRSGGVVRLTAKHEESGKTSEAFVLAANYMGAMPNSKTLYVKAEARLSHEMKARTGLKFVDSPTEWAHGTVFVLSCNVFEVIADTIVQVVKSAHEAEEHICIIIDSLDGLILRDDLSKGIGNNLMVAGVPKLTKLLFRHIALPIAHYDALLLITGQYSANIRLDPYSKEPPRHGDSSGGSSVGHQCDYVLSYLPRYQGDFILEKPDEKPDLQKNKIIGLYVGIEVKKSATDVTGTRIKIPIKKGRVGCAIWIEKEVVDMALQFGMLNRKGAWYTFDEKIIVEAKEEGVEIKPQHCGLSGVFEYVEENKEVFAWLLNKFRSLIE